MSHVGAQTSQPRARRPRGPGFEIRQHSAAYLDFVWQSVWPCRPLEMQWRCRNDAIPHARRSHSTLAVMSRTPGGGGTNQARVRTKPE